VGWLSYLPGVVLLVSLSTVAILANESVAQPFPQLRAKQTRIDLGKVGAGTRQSLGFLLKNPHNRHVTITRIDVSCHCLTPTLPQWVIGPSQEFLADLQLDLTKEARFHGSLLIEVKAFTDENELAFSGTVEVQVTEG